jgi:predicted flap endonuclease-1-like 5' DNA nuclease
VAWFIGQSLLIIGAAFALGLLVGWLVWGRPRRVDDDTPAGLVLAIPRPAELVPADPEVVAAEPEVVAPVAAEPEDETEDDLQRIEGIGPRMAGALHEAGIRSFRQLAEIDETTLRAAIEAAGLSFAPSLTTWSRQARLLAGGDEEGFADLARRLVAGRDVGRA